MLQNYLLCCRLLFSGISSHFFKIPSVDKRLLLSVDTLLTTYSYRLPDYQKKNPSILFRMLYRSLKIIWFGKLSAAIRYEHDTPVAVMAGSDDNQAARKKYLEGFLSENPAWFINGNSLLTTKKPSHKMLHSFFLIILLPFLLPFIFSKNRANWSLLLFEIPEIMNLLCFLQREKITTVYYFNAYEKDANFKTYLLMRKGIAVHKIPQILPLSIWYQKTICNKLFYFYEFQKEEFQHNRDTILADEIVPAPHIVLLYMKKEMLNKSVNANLSVRNHIGFLSSGEWLRQQLYSSQMPTQEEEVFKNLVSYIEKNPACHLYIYLHPLEKKNRNKDSVTRYYAPYLAGGRIHFANENEHTYHSFQKVNIGITFWSSAGFELLYTANKILFYYPQKKNLFSFQTHFENLFAGNNEELIDKLNKNLPLSTEDFFRENGLDYRLYTHFRYSPEWLTEVIGSPFPTS